MMPTKLQLMVTKKYKPTKHEKHPDRVVRQKVVDFSTLEKYLN